jgi:ribosomal protein L7/L12
MSDALWLLVAVLVVGSLWGVATGRRGVGSGVPLPAAGEMPDVEALARDRKTFAAVKAWRARMHAGLIEAKRVVDAMARRDQG